MPRQKRPRQWFRLYASTRHVFESLSNDTVGEAVIYALRYFELGEMPPARIEPLTQIAFNILKGAADEAIQDYEAAVLNGAKGPAAREARRLKEGSDEGNPG